MQPLQLNGKYTLVTGASSGLGRELAREIARTHGGNLVLVARRRERLDELAKEVEASGAKAVCIAADLSKPDDVERVFREATEGREVHAAILNAGVTYFGHHLELSESEAASIIHLNVSSVVKLANQFLSHQLSKSPGGGVLVVSSLTGNTPTPYQALYSGTKAFLNQWGVSLATELQGTSVSLTVAACGGMVTEMGEKSGTSRLYGKGSVFMMPADSAARIALRAFLARRRYVIPGAMNLFLDVASRFGPRVVVASVMKQAMRAALLPAESETPPKNA